jgi:hypothetical protein
VKEAVEALTRLAQALTPAAGEKREVACEGRLAPLLGECHLFRPPGFSPDGAIIPRLLRRSGKGGTLQTAPTYRRSDC